MAELQIHQFPCLSDNYGVLIHDADAGVTASIDAPEAAAVERALESTGWRLTHILTTHHHADHTGGHAELKQKTGCTIVGPRGEADKIPGIDVSVGEGDTYTFGNFVARVFETPGHTSGHIVYYFPDAQVVFVGDTLFALGCGRLLEGTAEQMWSSLKKLMQLPPETAVYCGHEYTQSNARFALAVDPDNAELQARAREIDALRAQDKPTLPTTIGLELATNPFLRAEDESIQRHLGMVGADPVQVFAEIRRRKDTF